MLPLAHCFPLCFATCACSGAVGELLSRDIAESWQYIEKARDVANTLGRNHGPAHDVRGEISPSECGTDHLAALVPLHPVEGTTKRELFIEAKFTSFKGYLSGKHRRLAVRIWFRTDPTGTLVIVTIVLLSARCMVQLARAGSEMQAGYWIASVVWNPPSESLGRAEVRLLRCMLSKGWFAVGLIGINRPGDASVPLSQVY